MAIRGEAPPAGPARRVLTVTVDPSLDATTKVPEIESNIELRAEDSQHDPGAGGINVARAMQAFESHATALWARRGAFGAHVGKLLDEQGLSHIPIEVQGDVEQGSSAIEDEPGESVEPTVVNATGTHSATVTLGERSPTQ